MKTILAGSRPKRLAAEYPQNSTWLDAFKKTIVAYTQKNGVKRRARPTWFMRYTISWDADISTRLCDLFQPLSLFTQAITADDEQTAAYALRLAWPAAKSLETFFDDFWVDIKYVLAPYPEEDLFSWPNDTPGYRVPRKYNYKAYNYTTTYAPKVAPLNEFRDCLLAYASKIQLPKSYIKNYWRLDYSSDLDSRVITDFEILQPPLRLFTDALAQEDSMAAQHALRDACLTLERQRSFFRDLKEDLYGMLQYDRHFCWPIVPENYQVPACYSHL